MESKIYSKSLDHLGLVSGMIDKLGIVSLIDSLLKQDQTYRNVSIGNCVKALIINGLGFSQRTLYLTAHFFEDKPCELLFGPGVVANHFNDTVLGRCLDDIWAYGTSELYAELVPEICKKLSIVPQEVHLDSTSFHLDGVYNSESAEQSDLSERCIHLTKGYSRDHRPDLNQVILNLIVESKSQIPLQMEALSGNANDQKSFQNSIEKHISCLQNTNFPSVIRVMDSAGYSQENLRKMGQENKWISRVPEKILACKEAIEGVYCDWNTLESGNKYIVLSKNCDYANIKQRWHLVYSEQAYKREVKTLKKTYLQNSEAEYKQYEALKKTGFTCQSDAVNALNLFSKKCKYLIVNNITVKQTEIYTKKGRPQKQDIALKTFYPRATLCCCIDAFEEKKRTKGRFIIATNEGDKERLADEELLLVYKGQSVVEKGFRFMKDPQFIANTFFVKKPQRVDALLFIMTLTLSVYAGLEYQIREELNTQKKTIKNQINKPTKTPTARWVFQLFGNIQLLYEPQKKTIINLKVAQTSILEILGEEFEKYYKSP